MDYDKIKESVEEISKQGEIGILVESPNQEEINNMKNGVFTIEIQGVIGEDVKSSSIKQQLEKANGQDIVLEIASPGGEIFEGIEIFNSIRNYKGNTTAKITGMAASMASYIPLASNKVVAENNAVFMIHNAWSIVQGDAKEMREKANFLENLNELLAQEYIKKTGKKEKEILQMMQDTTYLFGSEIKETGFADEMIIHEKERDDTKKENHSKETKLSEAKNNIKNMFEKMHKEKMQLNLNKISKFMEENKMKKEIVSKFAEGNVEAVKAVLDKMKEMSKSEDIKKEELVKLTEELEAAIVVQAADNKSKDADPKEDPKDSADDKKDADPAEPKDTPADPAEDKPDENDDQKEEPADTPEEGEDKDAPADPADNKSKDTEGNTSKQSDEKKAYKEVANEAISKLEEVGKLYKLEKDKNETLTKENISLNEQISKFKQDTHNSLVLEVIEEISKMKSLDNDKRKEEQIQLSKMSDEALDIMKAKYKEINLSKMEEEIEDTRPSQDLDGQEGAINAKEDTSKFEETDEAIKKTLGYYNQ